MSGRSGVTVAAPSSKSLSHRKIITSGLAEGVSTLSNVLESEDTARTVDILSLAGANISRKGKGVYEITGTGGRLSGGPENTPLSCYLHESGTSARLLSAVLAAGTGAFHLHGAPRLHERPMNDLFSALERLGASFSWQGTPGNLPAILRGNGIAQHGDAFIPVSCDVSSQFLSGLLLAAPLSPNGLRLLLAGSKTVSWPYVSLTLHAMQEAGCPATVETLANGSWQAADWRHMRAAVPYETRFIVPGGVYKALAGTAGKVEGDYSGASYLLAAGAVGPDSVTVTGLSPASLQGDAAIVDILRDMGAGVSWNGDAVTVSPGRLTGINRDMGDCPDLVPTVAVLASLAQGETRITGVAHLAQKESDRLAAPAVELAKTGCAVTVTGDGLIISPPATKKNGDVVAFSAHNDHRMAMSLALFERAGFSIRLDDPACVAKSFPEFWRVWKRVCPATTIAATTENM